MSTESSTAEAAPVALYIQRGCAVCHQVRRLLEDHQIDFEIKWLSDPQNIAEMDEISRTYGVMGFPVLMIGTELIEGYDPPATLAQLRAAGHNPVPRSGGSVATGSASRVPPDAVWVANLSAGLVSFVTPGSSVAPASDLAFGPGAMPCGIGWDPETDVVAVSDFALHRVVFFNRSEGTPLRGSLDESSLPMPKNPGDIVTDLRRHRFYVSSAEEPGVTSLDSSRGAYSGDSLASSFLPLPRSTNAIAFDPRLDRLYLRSGGIVAIDVDSFTPVSGGVWGQRDVLFGRDVRVSSETGLLYVPGYAPAKDGASETHRLFYLRADSGEYACGDAVSSGVRTDETPWVAMPATESGAVYLACMGSQALQRFDATRPVHLGDPDRRLDIGPACRSMTLDPKENILVVSSFDEHQLTFVDPRQFQYRYGTKERSTVNTAEGPRSMLFVGPAYQEG